MYLMVYIFLYSDARYTKHYPPQKSLFTISMDMPLETEENPTDNGNT